MFKKSEIFFKRLDEENMEEVKIYFSGFTSGFDYENNEFTRILRKKYQVIISEKPDYLFYSCFSDEHFKYDCVKIFATGENMCPDFNLCDYALGFEYMSYEDRYLRYPIYASDYITWDRLKTKQDITEAEVANKTEFCGYVVSNNFGNPIREVFFDQLSEYKKVNSGGRFRNNIGEPQGVKDKHGFLSKHKFTLAFENSSHNGYLTEKLPQALAAGTIPIYWGDPTVATQFNEKAFINCHNYKNMDEVVERIKEIDENDQLLLEILQQPAVVNPLIKPEFFDSQLESFILHIFQQPFEQGFRRDREAFGHKCEVKYGQWYQFYKKKVFMDRLTKKVKAVFRL